MCEGDAVNLFLDSSRGANVEGCVSVSVREGESTTDVRRRGMYDRSLRCDLSGMLLPADGLTRGDDV